MINLHYVELGFVQRNTRVTFEAANNVDMRLGTGKYRYTHVAAPGDMAAISRISEHDYEIRILRQGTPEFNNILPYGTTYIGIRDKRLGYLNNDRFEQVTRINLTSDQDFNNLPIRG